MKAILCGVIGLAATAFSAIADEKPIDLKSAPGKAVVESNCASCHSLDYIRMNSPFMNEKVWEAEVTKMIKTFGAPITDADAKTVVEYLVQNYGG